MAQGFCHEVCRMMRIRQNNLGHLRQFGQSQNLVGSQVGVNCGAVSIFPLSLISLIWFKLSGLFVVLPSRLVHVAKCIAADWAANHVTAELPVDEVAAKIAQVIVERETVELDGI